MSDAPIRVDSRAWTGDPAIAPIEYEVLSRKSRARDKREGRWALTAATALVGMLIALPIDLLVWSIGGSRPYIGANLDSRALFIGVAVGAIFAAFLVWIGRRKLLPLVPLPAIMGITIAGGAHYLEASKTQGRVETTSFFIQDLDLHHSGRRSFHTRRFRASAGLIDRHGRRRTLNGRYQFISQLANQDCLTVDIRHAGGYRFAEGPLTLMETPYIDNITGKRHPARCFNPAR